MFTFKKKLKRLFTMTLLSAFMMFAFTFSAEAAGKIKLNASKATLATDQGILLELKGYSGAVKWSSSNKKVATVNKNGLVKAKKKGSTVITAKAGKKKYKCKITVKALKVKSLKLNKKTVSLKKGDKITLKATVSPANAFNKGVTWKSSDTRVATVSSKGVVTAKKNGTATITATTKDGSKKRAACKVSIKAKSNKSESTESLYNYSTDIRIQARFADPILFEVFEKLGFHLSFDKNLYCEGVFSPRNQKITLKYPGVTIYHELGHFLAFIAKYDDYTAEWQTIYDQEKNFVFCDNEDYVTQDPQEYFAESYEDFVLDHSLLKNKRPLTYAYINKSLDEVRNTPDDWWESVRSSYRISLNWN